MAYNKSPFKMKPKSPLMKALIGNQKNLNEGLKAAIQASPAKMAHKESPSKMAHKSPSKMAHKSPAKKYKSSPMKQKMEMVEVNGKKVPKFAADGKGAGDLKKSSPAKGYKSAAQRKAVHASKADGGAGHPDKKKSPAKQMSKLKKSPAKQCGGFKSAAKMAHKKSPAKQIGVNKKDTKAFETTKRLENKGERKIARLEKRKKKVVDRINKKAERKATRILSAKKLGKAVGKAGASAIKKYGKSPAKAHCTKK
tara:strand:- start:185 stop:943 length:759 start_codon:yes stop_codon:yes gene_type:complete